MSDFGDSDVGSEEEEEEEPVLTEEEKSESLPWARTRAMVRLVGADIASVQARRRWRCGQLRPPARACRHRSGTVCASAHDRHLTRGFMRHDFVGMGIAGPAGPHGGPWDPLDEAQPIAANRVAFAHQQRCRPPCSPPPTPPASCRAV